MRINFLGRKFVVIMGIIAMLIPGVGHARVHGQKPEGDTDKIRSVRIVWPLVPGAVYYKVELLSGAKPEVYPVTDKAYLNGLEVDLSAYDDPKNTLFWRVRPYNYWGEPIGDYTKAQSIKKGAFNPVAPLPMTDFSSKDDMLLYPVFAWIPTLNAHRHEIEVYKKDGGLYHHLQSEECCAYDFSAYDPGEYYWRVRALDQEGHPLSRWSDSTAFQVKAKADAAALGDSITHGGGAMSVPPCYKIYNWETYAGLPIKNLGLSGNTTAAMVERFERDVLPFRPKILVIMGGVNDFREGGTADTVIQNLTAIRDKCYANNILPVFATATPINGPLMDSYGLFGTVAPNWRQEQMAINQWILTQRYCVDVSTLLADEEGNLRKEYTTDGLHPDDVAKKYIGQRIGEYLRITFPSVTK